MRLVAPEHIDMISWFDALRASLPNVYIPSLQKEDDWKMVASFIRNYHGFYGKVPAINGFDDWQEWARAFYNQVAGG